MSVSYEFKELIIQCIGNCFHYKDNVESFFVSCGVDKNLTRKHKDLAKFLWARNLLNDLDEIDNGELIQRRIVTELCKFRKLPDSNVPNPNAGIASLRRLKEIAIENNFIVKKEKADAQSRKNIILEKSKIIEERKERLIDLRIRFYKSFSNNNRQQAGYELETILEELFALSEIDYRKPYKTSTQQIDGHFHFEGFDYLIESKWTNDCPNESEIGGFLRKIETKLESTRGVFVSINGFRDEVVSAYNGKSAKILFFSGEDLTHILEGRIDLKEALALKIRKAAQEGLTYFILKENL